jgi:hypothetical protein
MSKLGTLKLPLTRRQYFLVEGGPFYSCPPNRVGVKMAREINKPCYVNIPTYDYNVPDIAVLNEGLTKAVEAMLRGQPLYVGCMGGKGRTGLFLAILSKAFGVHAPIEYVRQHYYSHAVETPQQADFVKGYRIPLAVDFMIQNARRKMWWRFWRTNLTLQSVADI